MRAPKCRLCGKEHYGQCKANDFVDAVMEESGRPTDKARAREPLGIAGAFGDEPRSLKASRDGKRVVEPVVLSGEPTQHDSDFGIVRAKNLKVTRDTPHGPALTPAEKQKAYRERNAEEKREANKLRMRRKRDARR